MLFQGIKNNYQDITAPKRLPFKKSLVLKNPVKLRELDCLFRKEIMGVKTWSIPHLLEIKSELAHLSLSLETLERKGPQKTLFFKKVHTYD